MVKRASVSERKDMDAKTPIKCAAGMGEIREETWVDGNGDVCRYNLAFICFGLFAGDNGRVLGYDTAHGRAHRHFAGAVTYIDAIRYEDLLNRFILEVAELRERKRL
jgi:hypothetical protein